MPLSNLLSIARSALFTYQRSMDVTANNIANAQTPGYSRQRLTIAELTPVTLGDTVVGRGVTDVGVERVRDRMLDAGFRRESGALGQSDTMRSYLSQIESAVGEPTNGGIAAGLDAMFQSFGDLANDPANTIARDQVRNNASHFIQQLHDLAGRLVSAGQDAASQLQSGVNQVNSIAKQIAALNTKILASPGPLHNSAELQDQRDLLVDQLSSLMQVRVTEHPDGTIAVAAGDTTLVDGGSAGQLAMTSVPGGGYAITGAQGTGVDALGGSLKALSTLTTTTIPGMMSKLDQLASAVVGEVNNLHRTGTNLNGQTNVDFFDPAGVTALTLSLSSAVTTSSDNISAGMGASGDGSLALKLSQLANQSIGPLGDVTFRQYYIGFAGDVGAQSSAAIDDTATYQALVDGADAQRDSVSGVSIDEEMVNMINLQQAYGAAARMIVTAQDMMDTILKMV